MPSKTPDPSWPLPPFTRPVLLVDALEDELCPRPLVAVNGTFDIPHPGHLQILQTARRCLGPIDPTVLLLLDSDEMVRSKKSDRRPVLSFYERATWINLTRCIDYIIEIGSDEEFIETWNMLIPDIRVRGEEYKGKKSRVTCPKTIWVPNLSGLSTTEIERRIVDKFLEAKELGEK